MSKSKAETPSISQTSSNTKGGNGNQPKFNQNNSSLNHSADTAKMPGINKHIQNNSSIVRRESGSSSPKHDNLESGMNDEGLNGNDEDGETWVKTGSYNRKRGGQNSARRGNVRGFPREPNTNYQNRQRGSHNSNGYKGFESQGYASRRGRGNVTNNRGQERSPGFDFGRAKGQAWHDGSSRNKSSGNAASTLSSYKDGDDSKDLKISKNAWQDNTTPISESFENPALENLLPRSEKEEQEMIQYAMKLSLQEETHGRSFVAKMTERKSSNCSEQNASFDEITEARKMLQPSELKPLPALEPSVLSTNIVTTLALAPESKTEPHVEDPIKDQSCNGLDRSSPEDWDKLGARPKEKTQLPVGRGTGRGKRESEGKIGELIAKPATRLTKAIPISSEIDSEQYEAAGTPSSVSNEEFVTEEKEKTIVKTTSSQTECDILPKKLLEAEKGKESLVEKKSLAVAEPSTKETEPEMIETTGSIAIREEQLQTKSPSKSPAGNSEQSKDDEIRVLREELHRLSNREPVPAYPPPSFGVSVPLNMVPAMPMAYPSYYRFPYPALAVAVDPNCMQYAAPLQQSVHMVYPQNTFALQQNIPTPCLSAAPFASPPPNEFMPTNNYRSRLSPNAAEFFPGHSSLNNERVQRGSHYSDYIEEKSLQQQPFPYRHQQRGQGQIPKGISRSTRGQYNNYSSRVPINSDNESNYYTTPPPFPNLRHTANPSRTGPDLRYNQRYSYRPNC